MNFKSILNQIIWLLPVVLVSCGQGGQITLDQVNLQDSLVSQQIIRLNELVKTVAVNEQAIVMPFTGGQPLLRGEGTSLQPASPTPGGDTPQERNVEDPTGGMTEDELAAYMTDFGPIRETFASITTKQNELIASFEEIQAVIASCRSQIESSSLEATSIEAFNGLPDQLATLTKQIDELDAEVVEAQRINIDQLMKSEKLQASAAWLMATSPKI